MSLLELIDVHSYYGHIHALQGISVTVNEGEIVTLIGANGAGKSTTLRTISGLVPARQGQVLFKDQDITHMKPHLIVAAGVGHVPEGRGIFPRLTVRENLEMGAFTITDNAEVARDTLSELESSVGDVYIGAGSTLETGTFWLGAIDDVRIYNRVIVP